ncbi:outer membrane protein assembly factor BamA [Pedosphaera parvula]|uniref:Outer membrane protein assembly factor BamA n=1 Tax=Pedosphaera parvula (strain Ellin514) TaxID=320771 RepID=B9XIE6_PEDPL|nr:outer membrane protein assembly factor BamA [Pedosphaera parvula]EEF60407.1 outer membrane protein assembly complex, YaeT protein [Pedosphaera parvula Ellin514]
MNTFIRRGGFLLLLLLAYVPNSSAQSLFDKVAQIIITNVGPATVSEDLVRANIHVKVGDPYVRTSVDDDVKNLYATGYFFNIQVLDNFTDKGVVLTYILQGKLRLTGIKFEGNTKYSNSKLLKKVTSKIGDPLDERKLFTDSQEIQKMYQKSGYPRTTVKYVISNIDERAGRASVIFEIQESPKIKIVEVDFTGANAFSQKKLRRVIKTRRHWWLSWLTRSGIFKPDQFDEDQEKLKEFYQEKGYIDFEIKDIRITNPTPKTMRIEFVIYEGNLYKVGAVTFKGNLLFNTNDIFRGLKLQHEQSHAKTKIGEHGLQADVGMTFTPQGLQDDIHAIEDFYGSKGYIDVKQGANLRVNKIANTENGTMDLEYNIDSGEKQYIEKIEIKGNVKTKDKVIRRELAVSPGDTFDMVRVRLSKQRLEGLQYFEKVDTQPEPTVIPNHKNLIVGVDEKSTGQFTFGAGFSTVDSILGFAEISQSNFDLFKPPYFTGGGQKFRLRVQLGTQRQDYLISFVEPWFLNRKLALSIDLFHSVYNFQSLDNLYNETHTGAKLGLTRALGSDFLIGGISYTVENVGIVDVNENAPATIFNDSGNTLLSRFGVSLAYDTRNSTTLPNKGQRTEISAEVVGGPLGGDANFYKTEVKSAWYFKGFAKDHVLEIVGRAGVADRLYGSKDLPFFERYYLGGQYSLRGYDYRGVGPREATQNGQQFEPIGGDTYWMASAEYSIPIISRLRFAVFYDIGSVYALPYSFQTSQIHARGPVIPGAPTPLGAFQDYGVAGSTTAYSDNWGLGLRLDLPIGPLRLDYGIPIHHDIFNSNSGKFQFGVGFARPL